jgi:hypothetical protein
MAPGCRHPPIASGRVNDTSDEPDVALKLESLAPEYSKERHSTYFAVLKRAVEEQPGVRNIALAGPYGVGKSSVLNKVADEFGDRVIKISLLTLGVEPEETATAKGGNPAAETTSNRIQKEIVKQLLYQQRPSDAPESRFRRIARFRWRRELLVASTAALVAVVLLVVAGVDLPGLAAGDALAANLPEWLRALAAYLAVATAVGAVVVLVRLLIQGRLGIEKVTAGPATITLPARSSSYFDEYLDEIIYFFETNEKCDLVILEDLDRFDDATIFESLRSLNGLLNSARQLDGRNVRFIYAARDSVFEKLGRDEARGITDEARAELVRANRTKFFELIIPVVPFITHKNARDLMFDLLVARGHTLSKDLVDLAARHLADMRLIHNIVNEYEVFKHLLLDVPQPVPQLDPERLFAMVVFKNAHMTDFENIRHGTSSLDKLYETWRSLVTANLRALRASDTRLRTRIENREAEQDYAAELASLLRARIDTLASAPGSGLVSGALHVDDTPVDDDTLRAPAFWRDLIDNDRTITLKAHRTTPYHESRHQTMKLSVRTIETLIGRTLDSKRWVQSSIAADRATTRQNRIDTEFLRHHTWQQLVERPRHTYAGTAGDPAGTFRQWVEHLMPSRLATDLVVNGYITSYFSLHVSAFYGQLIREDAMTYVMRNIDQGTADPDYPLDADDVDAILRDQGKSVLGERSMYNVSILDHLLTTAPKDAAKIVNRLAGGGADEQAFIDHYLSEGDAKRDLVAQITPLQRTVFTYLVEQAPLEPAERVELMDTAIACRSEDLTYELSPAVRSFLESNYRDLRSLTQVTNAHEAAALRTVRFIADTGAALPDITDLSPHALAALAHTRAYRITSRNLEQLSGSGDIALDILAKAPGEIYPYVVDRLEEYLAANQESTGTSYTINAAESFITVLEASEAWRTDDLTHLVTGAHPDCRLNRLDEAPHGAWYSLAATRRVPATFANVDAYVEWEGEVDADLATLLASATEIAELAGVEVPKRQAIAIAIVNSTAALSDTRKIKLARSLRSGVLPTSSIEPASGGRIGQLIRARLIDDDEEAFSERLMVDWPTQEFTIASSRNFVEFVGPETLRTAYIAPLMRSTEVTTGVQSAVLRRLEKFSEAPRDAYQAVAEAALASRLTLTAYGIEMIRRGGARTSSVLAVLARADDRIEVEDLRRTLRGLGEPYSVIADTGTRRPKVDDTTDIRAILRRLKEAGIVSRTEPEKGAQIRVHLNRK